MFPMLCAVSSTWPGYKMFKPGQQILPTWQIAMRVYSICIKMPLGARPKHRIIFPKRLAIGTTQTGLDNLASKAV